MTKSNPIPSPNHLRVLRFGPLWYPLTQICASGVGVRLLNAQALMAMCPPPRGLRGVGVTVGSGVLSVLPWKLSLFICLALLAVLLLRFLVILWQLFAASSSNCAASGWLEFLGPSPQHHNQGPTLYENWHLQKILPGCNREAGNSARVPDTG